jgi:hypothetical protein
MNSSPKDRDRSLRGTIEPRSTDAATSSNEWTRDAAHRKDAASSPGDDLELPTHVVGEHQTD